MSDHWADKYVEVHERDRQQKQQEEQEARERRRLAKAAAPEQFHALRERIKKDLRTLRSSVTFQSVELEEFPENKYTVIHRGSPRVEMRVELQENLIRCEYVYFPKESPQTTQAERMPKTLRICADLDNNITVHENGEKQALTGNAAVSELLLTPLLDYISK
jgi:hypothetical protein